QLARYRRSPTGVGCECFLFQAEDGIRCFHVTEFRRVLFRSMERQEIREGMKARSSNGKDLGHVTALSDQSFMIEKGWLFPKEYVASYDLISSVRVGEVWLSLSDGPLKAAASAAEHGAMPGAAAGTAGALGAEAERRGERKMEGERLEGQRVEAERLEGQRLEGERIPEERIEAKEGLGE